LTTLPTNNWNSPKNVNSSETQEKPFSHRQRNKEIADWDKENDKALGLIQMERSTWNGLKKAFATPTATAVFNNFQKLLAIKVSETNTLVQK